jgi:hypothetical protein
MSAYKFQRILFIISDLSHAGKINRKPEGFEIGATQFSQMSEYK